MNDPAWLVCVLAYGFGVAQTLRLRPTIGLPLLAVATAAFVVAVNIVDLGVPRVDLGTAWAAGLALGAGLALRAKHRAKQRAERATAQETR